MPLDRKARKDKIGVAPDSVLDGNVTSALILAADTDKARQGLRDQHHLDHRRIVHLPGQGQQHPHAAVGDEGKGVRRVNRLRGNHRQDAVEEIIAQPARLRRCQFAFIDIIGAAIADDVDILLGQQGLDLGPDVLLLGLKAGHALMHHRQLLHRGAPVDGGLLDPAAHLARYARHAHHQELIKVAARNRQEPQPLQQGIAAVAPLGQHALVKRQPRHLAVKEPVGDGAQGVGFGFGQAQGDVIGAGHGVLLLNNSACGPRVTVL